MRTIFNCLASRFAIPIPYTIRRRRRKYLTIYFDRVCRSKSYVNRFTKEKYDYDLSIFISFFFFFRTIERYGSSRAYIVLSTSLSSEIILMATNSNHLSQYRLIINIVISQYDLIELIETMYRKSCPVSQGV